jgi:hypothetical protein
VCFSSVFLYFFFFPPFLLHLGCVIVVEEKFTLLLFFSFFLLLWLLRASLSLAFVSVSEVGFYFIFRSFGLDDCRSIFLASFCDFVSVSEEGIPWSFWRK